MAGTMKSLTKTGFRRSRMTRLKLLRQRAGLSQAGLGDRSGINGVRICLTERERYVPSEAELRRLAVTLHFDGEPAALLEVLDEEEGT